MLSTISQMLKSSNARLLGVRTMATAVTPKTKSTKSKSKVSSNQKNQKPYTQTINVDTGKVTLPNKLYNLVKTSIEKGEPHFKVGGKQLYFPTARVVLLRPNAKHTPYQAKFIVPKTFNRMDLRDYLYHLYGLRVFKITTQLIPGKYTREGGRARYRTGSLKKMTVDLMEPFVWPKEPTKDEKEQWNIEFNKQLQEYMNESRRLGSDRDKPGKAFGGSLGPYPHKPEPFVPKFMKWRLVNEKERQRARVEKSENEKIVAKHLGL